MEQWSYNFSRMGINNGAALILDTKTGEVLAYIGNTGGGGRNASTRSVDIIQAKRSSGSLLKPFLYSAMLESGALVPQQAVIDVPTRIGSYRPDNNVPVYRGIVPADEALSRSLNIPAIRELIWTKCFSRLLEKSRIYNLKQTCRRIWASSDSWWRGNHSLGSCS